MSTTEEKRRPSLGQTTSTNSVSEVAMKLHAKYSLARGLVNDMSFEELTGNNTENYFIKFYRCCSTTSILKPRKKTEKDARVSCLSTATLCHYIGHAPIVTRDLFPDHSDWQGMRKDQFLFWWSEMRASFKKAPDRFQQTYSGDGIFGESNAICPLYQVIDHVGIDISKTEDYWKICDLKHIMHSLVNVAKVGENKLDQHCWVGMPSNCIGRSGEIKFQDYNDWKFDYQLSVTDTKWSEAKNISSYAMPMIPDSRWEFCWYHQMVSYFAVENGLW
jgi:hypothetical protein